MHQLNNNNVDNTIKDIDYQHEIKEIPFSQPEMTEPKAALIELGENKTMVG